jgi:pimeloyl-ACP methyl ester carboxylesterase
MIFPGASLGLFGRGVRDHASLPTGVTSHVVSTIDGEKLEVWKHVPESVKPELPVAIFFHGNGDTVDGFFPYQKWLGKLGMKSYGFDYRGFGYSTGWPSEAGLYNDADAVWRFVQEQEGVEGTDALIFGISIGSGPAAYLASKVQPESLVLLSGYSSLPELAADRLVYRYLTWLLRYEFSVKDYIASLQSTCLILSHGVKDSIISFKNLERLKQSYSGSGEVKEVVSKKAGHNDLINFVHKELGGAIQECQLLSRSS